LSPFGGENLDQGAIEKTLQFHGGFVGLHFCEHITTDDGIAFLF